MNFQEIKEALRKNPGDSGLHLKLSELYNDEGREELALMEKEISEGKEEISTLFRGLGIALTSRCYLECIMCDAWKADWDVPPRLVEELKTYIPNLEKIYWQGGEVFCSEYFEELFDKSLENPHLMQELVTSGLYITESLAEKFAASKLDLILSIDGANKKTYEKIRKKASFSKLKENLSILKKHRKNAKDLKLSINFVVMKSNYRELPDILEFAASYGIEHLMLTPIDHTESEENIFYHSDTEAGEYIKRITPELYRRAEELSIYLDSFIPPIEAPKPDVKKEKKESVSQAKEIFCYKPWEYMYIDIGGSVRPDCFCRIPVGDVNKETLLEIWNGEKMKLYRRKILMGEYVGFCNRICYECDNSGGCISGFPPMNAD